MVNLATVNYLPELQQYEAQIPRLEDGWWPTGGAVNPAADSGLMNWQASLLANRTAFLKKVIDDAGLGAAAVPLVTLNAAAARLTGSYRFASTDANTPASGVAGTLEVIAASANAVNQLAMDSASTRMWTRFWNGTVWSAWDLIWSAARGARSFGATGYSLSPDGMLSQWGTAAAPAADGRITLTFPTAFSSAASYQVTAIHFGTSPGAMVIEDASVTRTVTQLGLRIFSDAGTTSAGWIARWHAIGN
jgi:hypothetical protein